MVQAARSGKQNIVEGSKASGTSKEMEIKLTNVARASLEELLADYRDYLRVRDHALWDKDSKEAQHVRKLGHKPLRPMRLTVSSSKLARRRSLLISSSVSFTRRTTCSTNKSGGWRRIHAERRPARAHDPGAARLPEPTAKGMSSHDNNQSHSSHNSEPSAERGGAGEHQGVALKGETGQQKRSAKSVNSEAVARHPRPSSATGMETFHGYHRRT